MSGSSFYFDPSAEGMAVFMGPTEARLMELLWRYGNLTVKNAMFRLGYSRNPAYTTVQTILSRLCDKGLLKKQKVGRTYEYTPTIARDKFLNQRIREITACLDRNFDRS